MAKLDDLRIQPRVLNVAVGPDGYNISLPGMGIPRQHFFMEHMVDARDFVHNYVTHFTIAQPTTTPQLIEKVLSSIPADIRPGYACPATSLTFAYYQVDYHSVADALTTVGDHNGWRWYIRIEDNRIIFDAEEKTPWLKLLMPSN